MSAIQAIGTIVYLAYSSCWTQKNLMNLILQGDSMTNIEPAYVLHKQGMKYYIVPNVSNLPEKLPYPDNFLSFWFNRNAKVVLNTINAAWNDGYIYRASFGD
jgi:hypothetical protein